MMIKVGKSKYWLTRWLFAGTMLPFLSGCTDANSPSHKGKIIQDDTALKRENVTEAVAYLEPVKGNKVKGKVVFIKVPDGVKIIADIEGLAPGKHGFHIHEFGDCGGEAASAAGAHFNPTRHEHAGPDNVNRHLGDLGNLIADEQGRAHYERIDQIIQLTGSETIVGRSIIVHEKEDDYTTQPAGASGAKVSCGVIEAVKRS